MLRQPPEGQQWQWTGNEGRACVLGLFHERGAGKEVFESVAQWISGTFESHGEQRCRDYHKTVKTHDTKGKPVGTGNDEVS